MSIQRHLDIQDKITMKIIKQDQTNNGIPK